MREILFRGFARKANGSKTIEINGEKIRGQWIYWNVYGNLVNKGNTKIEWFKFCLPDGRPHDLNTVVSVAAFGLLVKETVEQYTGLTDKNGKKIFVGDIVTYPDSSCFGVVYFGDYEHFDSHHTGFFVKWFENDKHKGFRHDIRFWTMSQEAWVVGNIHDNPELLKQ